MGHAASTLRSARNRNNTETWSIFLQFAFQHRWRMLVRTRHMKPEDWPVTS
jgi:hypothetical protein